MISLVRLATMLRMSSLNCSENLQWHHRENISWSYFPPVLSRSVQCVGSCKMFNHCFDHQLKEEPGAVGDGVPDDVAGEGELEGELLVHKLAKARCSKGCKGPKVSSCLKFWIEWSFPVWYLYCTFGYNAPLSYLINSQVHCSRSQQTIVHFVLLVMADDGISYKL